jgi:hypothetical protein
MVRRLLLATTAAFLAVTFVFASTAAAYEVTFVLRTGERVTGQFSYNHTDHYQITVNGQLRDYPSDDIVMISFGAGDPKPEEVAKLPIVNDPPELERHTIVLKSAEMLRGKIYDFQGDRVIMDLGPNDRRTFNMTDISRLYISAPGSRAVYGVTTASTGITASAEAPAGAAVRVTVPARATWVDSGITVNRGDRVWFTASGQIYLSNTMQNGPEGVPNSLNRKDNPLPSANSGALLGQVGRSMFLIGNTTDPIVMPASGKLMLGINDDNHRDNRDAFEVSIRR